MPTDHTGATAEPPVPASPEAGRLGADLRRLVDAQPGDLAGIEELTRLRSPLQNRASFRLAFADGRVIKGRRFRSRQRCRMAASLAPLLADLPFNRVIASRGDAWLEQWIDGTALGAGDDSDDLARWAGDLMGRLHTLPVDPRAAAPGRADLEHYRARLQRNLGVLVEAGHLAPRTAGELLALAATQRPAQARRGLIHTDFCPDNIVATPTGERVMIDNEHLTLGALDYDLVKCWCRWPMSEARRRAFCEGYARHREPDAALQSALFWIILAQAQSARVRVLHGSAHRQPLDTLRRIAAGERAALWPVPAAVDAPGRW